MAGIVAVAVEVKIAVATDARGQRALADDDDEWRCDRYQDGGAMMAIAPRPTGGATSSPSSSGQ